MPPQRGIATVDQPESHHHVITPEKRGPLLLLTGCMLALLHSLSLENYLLFHILVEIFSVIVAFSIFMFAWNTRDNLNGSTFMILGLAYLVVGALDLLHTISYKGMGVFPDHDANTATQLWVLPDMWKVSPSPCRWRCPAGLSASAYLSPFIPKSSPAGGWVCRRLWYCQTSRRLDRSRLHPRHRHNSLYLSAHFVMVLNRRSNA